MPQFKKSIINPIMRNTQKPQIGRMASVQMKKTLAVTKCFICNQMFYTQSNFDQHMKLHSAKLSKNVPGQMQRKTMQSFKIKKSSTNNSNSNNKDVVSLATNKNLNQTATFLTNKVQVSQKQKFQDQQQQRELYEQRNQCKQAQQALRQSTILIQKLQSMMQVQKQDISKQMQIQQKRGNNNQKIQQVQPYISEQQYINKIIDNNEGYSMQIQKLFNLTLKTQFQNEFLQSCQDQITYIAEMEAQLGPNLNKNKINNIKEQILKSMITYVRSTFKQYNNKTKSQVKQQIKQKNSLNQIFITSQMGKNQEHKQKQNQQTRQNIRKQQNLQPRCCGLCYGMIQYGQQCYKSIKNIKGLQQQQQQQQQSQFHTECWEQQMGQ